LNQQVTKTVGAVSIPHKLAVIADLCGMETAPTMTDPLNVTLFVQDKKRKEKYG
jgi:hypothetical protein